MSQYLVSQLFICTLNVWTLAVAAGFTGAANIALFFFKRAKINTIHKDPPNTMQQDAFHWLNWCLTWDMFSIPACKHFPVTFSLFAGSTTKQPITNELEVPICKVFYLPFPKNTSSPLSWNNGRQARLRRIFLFQLITRQLLYWGIFRVRRSTANLCRSIS